MQKNIVNIMIVEDEVILRVYIKKILQELGEFQFIETASGQEAISLAREIPPHLILMDIKLADHIDGFEAARAICEERPVPIIFMSAYDYAETISANQWPCPVKFYSKPVMENDISAFIEALP